MKNQLAHLMVGGWLLLGVVDQIEGRQVSTEIRDHNGETMNVDLPLWIFPCAIKEGDMFYFTKPDGVLELRCGEPPE